MTDKDKIKEKIDEIITVLNDKYNTDPLGPIVECTAAAQIEALNLVKDYINSMPDTNKIAEAEKDVFVSGHFLRCLKSFNVFKQGEHYWLEYIGDDKYIGRSDNILNDQFYISPRQLFTSFSEELQEHPKTLWERIDRTLWDLWERIKRCYNIKNPFSRLCQNSK